MRSIYKISAKLNINFILELSQRMYQKFWANIIRYYTGKVRRSVTRRASRRVASGVRFLIAGFRINLDFTTSSKTDLVKVETR